MSARIDTDKIRGWVDGGVYRDEAARDDLLALCDEVDAIRSREVPDGWQLDWVSCGACDSTGIERNPTPAGDEILACSDCLGDGAAPRLIPTFCVAHPKDAPDDWRLVYPDAVPVEEP